MAQPPPPKPAAKSKGPPPRGEGSAPPPKRSESNVNQQTQQNKETEQQNGTQQASGNNAAQSNPNQQSSSEQQQTSSSGGGANNSGGGQSSGPPPKRSQPPEQNQQSNSGSGGGGSGGGNAPAPKRGPTPQQQQQQQQQSTQDQSQNQQQSNRQGNGQQSGQQQQQQKQEDDRPVANTTIVKSGSKRIFTAEEEAEAPYGNDRTAETVFELEGLNFALYEGLKEVDENKRRQFDNEVHQSVWSALEMLNVPPQDVHTRVGPGVISAVLLRYQAGAYPSLVDADWSIRVHCIVRLSGSNNASSIRRALQGYARSPKAFIGVARLYQVLFDQIVDRIKVEVIDPEVNRPTITGSNFHSYATAPYVQRQEEESSRYATSSVREDRSYRSDRGSRPYGGGDETRRSVYHDEEAEFEDDRRSYRRGEATPGRRSVVREETSYVSERGSRYDEEPPRSYRTTRVIEHDDDAPRSYRTQRVVEDDEHPRSYRTTRVVEEQRGRGERAPRETIIHEDDDVSYVSRSSAPRSRSRPRQVRTETRYVDEANSSDEEAVYYNTTSRTGRSPASTRSYRTVQRSATRGGEPASYISRRSEREYNDYVSSDEDVVYDRRVTRYHDPADGGREVTTYRANSSPSRMFRGQLVDREGYTVSDGGFYVRVSEVNPRY